MHPSARQSERKKKTSLRVFGEVVEITLREHKERRTHYASLCKVSLSLKLSTFLQPTALQRCKLNCNVRGWKEFVGSHEVA